MLQLVHGIMFEHVLCIFPKRLRSTMIKHVDFTAASSTTTASSCGVPFCARTMLFKECIRSDGQCVGFPWREIDGVKGFSFMFENSIKISSKVLAGYVKPY